MNMDGWIVDKGFKSNGLLSADEISCTDENDQDQIYMEVNFPESRTPKEVAEAHWEYVEEVIKHCTRGHNLKKWILALIKFMYITAFIHGWKHAKEEIKDNE